ncbi:MAG: glycoside hydrolase family 3 C-terminal domain-containing protein [Bacteroidales bacterium]|nr:glycoside hydrolase family 3 C-terminal domain-containing protein [Bacteroidales bacterium]
MKRILIPLLLALTLSACTAPEKKNAPAYLDPSVPLEQRVEDALARMTREEKVAMTHAQSKFSSPGVPRLGIAEVWHTDGPHGIRPEVLWDKWSQAGWTNDSSTAFPALSALAASWDRDLALLFGRSIGEEARYRKKDILLGPGVNMGRTPLNGRTFEYMGEDPYLAAQMVVPYVRGVQENGVAACVKHFAMNNQEVRRTETNSIVDDRTLYEIYLPAFKAAVTEGDAWAIMGSYNLYNGQFNCHNKRLLCDILKGEWGFDGVVVSDWGGCRDDDEPVTNGLDIEMGTGTDGLTGSGNPYDLYHLANPYLERLKDGRADEAGLDDKARRILRTIFQTSMSPGAHYGRFVSPEHYAAARKIAAESIVLLKNDGVLPLQIADGGSLLVVGENAYKKLTVGGGSTNLKTKQEIIPLEALHEYFDGKVKVSWERGYVGDITTTFDRVDTGQDLRDERSPETLIADAVAAAAEADVILFIGGLNKSANQDNEGTDRTQLELPYGQEEVIRALAETGKPLVVVNISGSAIAMPWADVAGAIVQGWYGGSENGRALVDVLTGAVNPSGKLPFTVPFRLEDGPLKTERQYPGIREEGQRYWDEYYDEGVYIGYRWYDTQGIPVQFPFGYGLSYTTFEYSDAKVAHKVVKGAGTTAVSEATGSGKTLQTVTVRVKNTGPVAGAEVVQLYVADPEASVDRPAKELKGFQKVFLQPGEAKTVSFDLDRAALSWFDAGNHSWVAEPGTFQILVGSSSTDIRTTAEFQLK